MANNWHALHYNAIAKEIRELFPEYDPGWEQGWENDIKRKFMMERAILTKLAINLASRFEDDNERFDPIQFLNQCSPNVDLYPLGELWEQPKTCKECDGPIHGTGLDVHDSCRRYPD